MENDDIAFVNENSSAFRDALHGIAVRHRFAESAATMDEFVRAWECGTLPKARWTHGAHVGTAAYFAFEHSVQALFRIMKLGILHYNLCVGTPNTEDRGYHETLTRFWAGVVGDFVHDGAFPSRLAAVRNALARFGEDRDRFRVFYSFDVVRDRRARREWVAPDREPVPLG
jgi:hypothetical protein